jgi:hypothetical protein
MNKQIRQLAETALEYAQKNQSADIPQHWFGLYNEKFAQLIVAECLEACSRANEIRHFVPPTQEQVVLSCMREIETHFGVEE